MPTSVRSWLIRLSARWPRNLSRMLRVVLNPPTFGFGGNNRCLDRFILDDQDHDRKPIVRFEVRRDLISQEPSSLPVLWQL